MKTSKRPIFSKIVRIVSAVGGTAGILFLAWKYLSFELLFDSLRNLNVGLLLGALLLYAVISCLRGFRFVLISEGLSFGDAFSMATVHNALLRVMPFRSGELAYGIMLKQMGKGGFGRGMASLLVLRLLDLAFITVIAAVSVGSYFASSRFLWSSLLIGFFVLAMSFLFFASAPLARSADKLVNARAHGEKMPLWARALKALAAVLRLSLRRRILLSLSTLLLWGVMLSWFYLLMLGAGMSIGIADGFSAGVLGVIGSLLPLSVVGNFGPQESGFALGFCSVGYTPEVAAAHSVVVSALSFVQNWILAVPGWFWVLSKSRKNKTV